MIPQGALRVFSRSRLVRLSRFGGFRFRQFEANLSRPGSVWFLLSSHAVSLFRQSTCSLGHAKNGRGRVDFHLEESKSFVRSTPRRVEFKLNLTSPMIFYVLLSQGRG